MLSNIKFRFDTKVLVIQRKTTLRFSAALCLASIGFGIAFAAAQTSQKGPLAKELASIVQELNEVRKQRQLLSSALPDAASTNSPGIGQLKRQIDYTQSLLDQLEASSASEGAQASSSSARPAGANSSPTNSATIETGGVSDPSSASALNGVDAPDVVAIAERALASVRQISRTQRHLGREAGIWAELEADLGDAAKRPQAIARFVREATAVVTASRQVTVDNQAIIVDSGQRRLHAFVLELGALGRVFLSEDEREAGIWDGADWQLQHEPSVVEEIRAGVRAARRLENPRFLALPLISGGALEESPAVDAASTHAP